MKEGREEEPHFGTIFFFLRAQRHPLTLWLETGAGGHSRLVAECREWGLGHFAIRWWDELLEI